MSDDETRAIKGQLLLELREAEAALACAEKRLRNFGEQLTEAVAAVNGATMLRDQVAVTSDGRLMRRDTGAVKRWPTYEEVAGAMKELDQLRESAAALKVQADRALC